MWRVFYLYYKPIINTNIYNMKGNLIMVKNLVSNQSTLNIKKQTNCVYLVELNLRNGSTLNSNLSKNNIYTI